MTHRDNVIKVLKEKTKDFIFKDKKLLEIGPGSDQQLKAFFIEREAKYTGCDIKKWKQNPENDVCPMEKLTYENETFDFIFSCHSFEHCENPIQALKEMHRVLKKDGRILMATPWPCKHQIIEADPDHIFVLPSLNLIKLCLYAGFSNAGCYEQKDIELKEQDWNIFTEALK